MNASNYFVKFFFKITTIFLLSLSAQLLFPLTCFSSSEYTPLGHRRPEQAQTIPFDSEQTAALMKSNVGKRLAERKYQTLGIQDGHYVLVTHPRGSESARITPILPSPHQQYLSYVITTTGKILVGRGNHYWIAKAYEFELERRRQSGMGHFEDCPVALAPNCPAAEDCPADVTSEVLAAGELYIGAEEGTFSAVNPRSGGYHIKKASGCKCDPKYWRKKHEYRKRKKSMKKAIRMFFGRSVPPHLRVPFEDY